MDHGLIILINCTALSLIWSIVVRSSLAWEFLKQLIKISILEDSFAYK